MDKRTLDKLLTTVPREQWDDPPEDSYLYTLKCYAEVYGEGKATKMGWWDYWYMKLNTPDSEDFLSGEEWALFEQRYKFMQTGKVPLYLPGPSGYVYANAWIQWRGPEPFSGDQCQSLLGNGGWSRQFLDNLALYRTGLKNWQRGLEIGMAHGYFIIGPFVNLGPLRNTPEAATVGLLAGCALIGIASSAGLLFSQLVKPKLLDEPGSSRASGFNEMMNWHAVGGLGGAGFAHALLVIFGS
jgi:photosystem I subunit 11